MTGTTLSVLFLHTYECFLCSQQLHLALLIWSILQMRRLRHGDVKYLPVVTQLAKGRGVSDSCSLAPWLLLLISTLYVIKGFPSGSAVKNRPAMQKPQQMHVQSLRWDDPLEEGMATHSILEKEMATYFSILAWEISWTEEPGGLQSMGSQKSRTRLTKQQHIVYTLFHFPFLVFSFFFWK